MTVVKKVRKPFNIQSRAGRNVRPTDVAVLDRVTAGLLDRGVTVLGGDLWARTPGILSFFAIAYEFDKTAKTAAPFGCVRVCFLRNGEVTVKVMWTKGDGVSHVRFDDEIKWK